MKIKVNGIEQEINKDALSIAELLGIAKVETPESVSVQLNGEFVDKAEFGAVRLKDNDEVDFLYFMGGGQR